MPKKAAKKSAKKRPTQKGAKKPKNKKPPKWAEKEIKGLMGALAPAPPLTKEDDPPPWDSADDEDE